MRVSCDVRGQPIAVGAGPDQHEESVGGDRLFLIGGALAQDQLLQMALASPADHLGARAHLHVRRRLDCSHQVVRHPRLERRRAHDEGDASGVAREVQGCLARRVSATGDVRVLPAQCGRLREWGAVENAGAVQRLQRGNIQAAVGRAGGEDHRSRADVSPVRKRHPEPVPRASKGDRPMHEHEARPEGRRLLVGLLAQAGCR